MSELVISRPPQFLDPWFVEIEQVWDELEASVNDIEDRVVSLEEAVSGTGVVVSISKNGDSQLKGNVTLSATGGVTLTQVGQNIQISASGGVTDHGALTGLADDDHTQYILAAGTRAFTGNQSFGMHQATNLKVEVLASAPAPGNQGRVIFDQSDTSFKVDNGIAFTAPGISDHGGLSGLADDDHTQYVLADGTRAMANITVNGKYKNEATEPFLMESQEDNTGSPVGFIMDTANNLAAAGAKLLSIRRAGVEKFYIDKDGNISSAVSFSLASVTSINALIDTDNDSSSEKFSVECNSATPGAGTSLFTVNESGEGNFPVGSVRIGSAGAPSSTLDVDGDADISGDLILGNGVIKAPSSLSFQVDSDNDETVAFNWIDGTAATVMTLAESGDAGILNSLKVGGLSTAAETLDVDGNFILSGMIKHNSDLIMQIDSDNDESAQFLWQNGTGDILMSLDESGNLLTTGTITGGASPFNFVTVEANGASAIGFKLNTQNAFSTSGAKILSLQNNAVEKLAIDKDGKIFSAAFTASRVAQINSSGQIESSSVTLATLAFLDATSSIQTQLDAKLNKSGGAMTGALKIYATGTATSVNSAGQNYIGVTSTASARTITLDMDDEIVGNTIIIKDESGGAATNNITIDTEGSSTIDGAASVVITANYGCARLIFRNSNWFSF